MDYKLQNDGSDGPRILKAMVEEVANELGDLKEFITPSIETWVDPTTNRPVFEPRLQFTLKLGKTVRSPEKGGLEALSRQVRSCFALLLLRLSTDVKGTIRRKVCACRRSITKGLGRSQRDG